MLESEQSSKLSGDGTVIEVLTSRWNSCRSRVATEIVVGPVGMVNVGRGGGGVGGRGLKFGGVGSMVDIRIYRLI